MNRILVIDDDPNIRELIHLILQKDGFCVTEACDGEDALQKLRDGGADLVVLDIMMPNMDGWEFCRKIRNSSDMPILMLTARSATNQKIKGFALGADDYLTKPFESAELVARIKALLKRCRITELKMEEVGTIVIDRNRYVVKTPEGEITLPLKEFDLLFKLAGSPGRTFSRELLLESVWGYDFEGNERTLDVHIGRLREKFPEDMSGFRISAVRGVGYRLEVIK